MYLSNFCNWMNLRLSIHPWQRRQWQPTPVLLPGKSHGQKSLVGCSPWGSKEPDMTERLHFHFSPSCIGEENGNSLQCSCLENARDRGAWRAAVYGVAQSQTWLKWLSSSSMFSLYIGYLRNIADPVPDHHNKANSTIKQVTWMFWFPSAHKSYVYTML